MGFTRVKITPKSVELVHPTSNLFFWRAHPVYSCVWNHEGSWIITFQVKSYYKTGAGLLITVFFGPTCLKAAPGFFSGGFFGTEKNSHLLVCTSIFPSGRWPLKERGFSDQQTNRALIFIGSCILIIYAATIDILNYAYIYVDKYIYAHIWAYKYVSIYK